MRGGGSRTEVRRTASSRRRRDRYTQDRHRAPWGQKKVLWGPEDEDDDDAGTPCRS